MHHRLSIPLLLGLITIFPAISIYAWQVTQKQPISSAEFTVQVNGIDEVKVLAYVNIGDGITIGEAEEIAEAVFTQVMGVRTLHRLDSLSMNGNLIEGHYTWGVNESDMSHFFNITGDATSHFLTVTHCK